MNDLVAVILGIGVPVVFLIWMVIEIIKAPLMSNDYDC